MRISYHPLSKSMRNTLYHNSISYFGINNKEIFLGGLNDSYLLKTVINVKAKLFLAISIREN